MSSDNELKNQSLVPSNAKGLTRYSSELIRRGLDLAKGLEQSKLAVEVDKQTTEIKKYQKQTWKCIHTLTERLDSVCSVAISPDSQTLASSSTNSFYDATNSILIRYSETKLWNIHTGNLLRTLPGCRLDAISPDGRIIASSGSDSGTEPWNIYIRDIYTRKLLKILSGHFGGVSCLAFSCDGQTLASGSYASEGGTLKVWNLNTGKVICTIYRNVGKSVFSVAISPDGQTLASIEAEQIIIWNLYTGELLRTFYYSGYSECVAFSLDGKILAGGSEGDTIMLWHPQTGELLSTLSGQEGDVLSIAFSSDGQTLASASSENIKIWDVYTGELLHTLTGNSNSVESIAFSPDGLTLVSGCSIYDEEMDDDYGIIEIWRLSA